jgi:hypothetical protein
MKTEKMNAFEALLNEGIVFPNKRSKDEMESRKTKAIEAWVNLGIVKAIIPFNCGGDEMDNFETFKYYDKNGNEAEDELLNEFFTEELEVNERVEFYECSNGHYIGENGNVEVNYNPIKNDFFYIKKSSSIWCESTSKVIQVKLNKKELELVKSKIKSMSGIYDNEEILYKDSTTINQEEKKIIKNLYKRLRERAENFENNTENCCGDEWDFTTKLDELVELELNENYLTVCLSCNYLIEENNDDEIYSEAA